MKETHFFDGMAQLSSYFSKSLTDTQKDYYFSDLKYISEKNFTHAIKSLIRNKKPNAGQFPTIFEIRGMCPPDTTRHYNPDETMLGYYHRITAVDLWQAFNILTNPGYDSFMSFCRTNHFNDEDIERVENKHKRVYPQGRLKKLLSKVGKQLPKHSEVLAENHKKLQAQKVDIYKNTETGR